MQYTFFYQLMRQQKAAVVVNKNKIYHWFFYSVVPLLSWSTVPPVTLFPPYKALVDLCAFALKTFVVSLRHLCFATITLFWHS